MDQLDWAWAEENSGKKGHMSLFVHILSFLLKIYSSPAKFCHYGSEMPGANKSHWATGAPGNVYDVQKLTAEKIYLYKWFDSQYLQASMWHL